MEEETQQETQVTEQEQPVQAQDEKSFTMNTHEKKLDILDKMFAKHPRRKARYFLVVGEWGPEKKTCVVHIESGAWISLENSFDETLERIEDKPDSDAPLLSAILTTRTMALENAINKSEEPAADPDEAVECELSCESKCETSCSADAP